MIRLTEVFSPAPLPACPFFELQESYLATIKRDDIGFVDAIHDESYLQQAQKAYEQFSHKKHVVHVGIGGSSLGPEMLIQALGKNTTVKFTFINNIDPSMMAYQLDGLDISQSVFFIVSKSGTTAETLAALNIIVSILEAQGIKSADWKNYLIFATDPVRGDLRQMSKDFDITSMEVPSNVGGRYSVLTPLGLFPALMAGIDVLELLDGAKLMAKELATNNTAKNPLCQLAHMLLHYQTLGRTQTVLMPYSSLLKEFTAWFVQLWAESLGKEGKGLTPLMAYGATDQHAQMQLFMEGPQDKVMLFLEIEEHKKDFNLKTHLPYKSTQNLGQYHLSQLFKAEFAGTLKALRSVHRPFAVVTVPKVDAKNLGSLILFFEALTVTVGQGLKIDPFNQPGVEAGKIFAWEWLTDTQANAPKCR